MCDLCACACMLPFVCDVCMRVLARSELLCARVRAVYYMYRACMWCINVCDVCATDVRMYAMHVYMHVCVHVCMYVNV